MMVPKPGGGTRRISFGGWRWGVTPKVQERRGWVGERLGGGG